MKVLKQTLWLPALLLPAICFSQTVQGDLPDSVVAKFQCKKLWSIVDASRNKFNAVRGARKPYKYTEAYNAKVMPKGINQAQITVEGRVCQYTATLAATANHMEAANIYKKFLPVIEICLEGWIFETEPADEDQLYRFKAYEKEDMVSGVTVELVFRKESHRGVKKFFVELTIQP